MKSISRVLLFALAGLYGAGAYAQDAFDACVVFTALEAEAALGTTVSPEPVNPKVKRPKVVLTCTYTAFKEGKPIAAVAQFRSAKNESDLQRAFDEHRLQVQTKPLLFPGAEGFWSAKTGQMNVRKGRTWVQISVGGTKPAERDADQSRKLAELLVKKL
jgi:hypothetical protein